VRTSPASAEPRDEAGVVLQGGAAVDAVQQHAAAPVALKQAFGQQAVDEVDLTHLRHQTGVERQLVHAVQDVTWRLRCVITAAPG
jgi:hypothetical protein